MELFAVYLLVFVFVLRAWSPGGNATLVGSHVTALASTAKKKKDPRVLLKDPGVL